MAKKDYMIHWESCFTLCMAKTNGVIQDLEREALKEILSKYSWASEIE